MKNIIALCFCILFTLAAWAASPIPATPEIVNLNHGGEQVRPDLLLSSEQSNSTREETENHSPTMGMVNSIVIFIRFADQTEFPTSKTYANYEAQFNADDGVTPSLKNYFKETSNQMLNISSHLYPNPQNGYVVSWQCPLSSDATGDEEWNVFKPALEWLDSTGLASGLNLDLDNNGTLDNVVFVVRNCQYPSTGSRDFFTNYAWYPELNGKDMKNYYILREADFNVSQLARGYLQNCGVPLMGGQSGAWDVMGINSNIPVHMSNYIKSHYMNWTYIPLTGPDNTYNLQPIAVNTFAAYNVPTTDPNQYYIIEYRKKQGLYESGLPSSGLIVYRVDVRYHGIEIIDWINYEAVYAIEQIVYAPGMPVSSSGNQSEAMFSSLYGRPTFDPYTNPSPILQDGSPGNLTITDIGVPSSTISFHLRYSAPKTWKGTHSSDWADSQNWWNGVPMLTEDVEIPAGTPHSPDVSSWSTCNNLFIYSGAILTVSASNLIVNNNLTTWGAIHLTGTGDLQVVNNLTWESGSVGTAATSSNDIKIQGSMDFKTNSYVALSNGNLEFFGDGVSTLDVHQPTPINNLIINKSMVWSFSFGYGSTANLTIQGDFSIINQSRVYSYITTEIKLLGNFTNSSASLFQFYYGTLTFLGNNKSITDQSGSTSNSFYNVNIGQTGNPATVNIYLNSFFNVNNLEIQSGALNPQSYTISVRGNWINLVGDSGFVESTSKVIFAGWADQLCTAEVFNTLAINKSMGLLQLGSGSNIQCNAYQWMNGGYRIAGGSFLAHDLLDAAICGTIILESGWIDYSQQTNQYVDLKANITINDGTFTVQGGNGPSDWPYGGSASLTMSGGVFDWRDVGIRVGNGSSFTENISGGLIKTGGGFACTRMDFTPTGGTLELTGTADAVISCSAGSNLYNLTINKAMSRNTAANHKETFTDKNGQHVQITRNGGVSNFDDIFIKGNVLIQSGAFSAYNTLHVAGNWTHEGGTFNPGSGTVEFYDGYDQLITGVESFNILVLNKTSGSLQVNDASSNVTCATYTHTGGFMKVINGSFTANDLSQNGIYGSYYVYPGATLNLHQDSAQYTDLNGDFNISGGYVNIYGGNGDSYWPFMASAGLTMSGGVFDFHSVGIRINSGTSYSFTSNITGGTIRTAGSFLVSRTDFTPSNLTLEMYGANSANLNCSAGSYLNHLSINKASSRQEGSLFTTRTIASVDRFGNRERLERNYDVTAASDLLITGNFGIYSGTFSAPALMQVKGNWSNVSGASVFNEGTGTVELNGTADQIIYCPSETFYTLKMNKPTGNLKIVSAAIITCSNYDWLSGGIILNTGTFTANDLVQSGIYGSYAVSTGSTVNLHQDGAQYIDLNGTLVINGGTFNVYGGSSTSDWSYGADAGLTLSSGTVDFKNHGINLCSSIHALALNISGGIIKTAGDFTITRSNVHINAGYVTLYGGNDAFLNTGATNSIFKLTIEKTTGNSVLLSGQVTVNSNLSIITGSLKQNGYDIYLKGDFHNLAGLNGFVPGLNTLFLIGNDETQVIHDPTNFYNITDQHTGASHVTINDVIYVLNNYTIGCDTDFDGNGYIYRLIHTNPNKTISILSGRTVTSTSYTAGGNVVVNGGSFTANDLTDDGIYGNYHLVSGQIDLRQGYDQFIDLNGNITIDAGTMNIWGGSYIAYTNYLGNCALIMNGGNLNIRDQGLIIQNDGAYNFTYSLNAGTISVGSSLYVLRSDFHPANTIIMNGTANANLSVEAGSYLYNLTINKAAAREESSSRNQLTLSRDRDSTPMQRTNAVSLSGNVMITKDINITAGQLSAGSYTLSVRGNWSDTVTGGGFIPGTSNVYFDGDANGTISATESFYNLCINKIDATTRNLYIAPSANITVSNYLNIYHGMVVMQNSCNLTSNGSVYLASGAGLDPNANTLTIGGSWSDDNTYYSSSQGFNPKTSTVVANGVTNTAFNTACPYLNFNNLNIDKGIGQLTTNYPVFVTGNIAVNSGTWYDNSDSTSYLYGNFTTSGTANLLWSNNKTLVFAGTKAQSISYGSSLGSFRNIVINKPMSIMPGTSQNVTLNSGITVSGNSGLDIMNGNLITNHNALLVDGNIVVNGLGKLTLDSSSQLKVGNDKTLTIDGTLESIGTSDNPALITSNSGYYTFNVESGGTLSAEYTIFEQVKAYGVEIYDGAIINPDHPLAYCTFRNGISSGTLLTINNNQNITLPNLVFPTNTWNGSYSVKKSINQGRVLFTSPTGNYAGPNHEYDIYNRLDWEGYIPDLQYISSSVSNSNLVAGDSVLIYVTIKNNSAVDITDTFYIDFYLNPSVTPTPGTPGDYRVPVYILMHGVSTTISQKFISYAPDTWTVYAQADGAGALTETNENNNLSPSLNLVWQAPVQSITLISPNGGESWQAGSHQPISWSTSNTTVDHIKYSIDNGTTWNDVSDSNAPSPYEWTVPDTPSTQCMIKLTNASGDVYTVSNAVFTITPIPSLTIPANLVISIDAITHDAILSWDADTGNPSGYRIYRSADPDFAPERTIMVQTNIEGQTTFTDYTAGLSGIYFYRVTAYRE